VNAIDPQLVWSTSVPGSETTGDTAFTEITTGDRVVTIALPTINTQYDSVTYSDSNQ